MSPIGNQSAQCSTSWLCLHRWLTACCTSSWLLWRCKPPNRSQLQQRSASEQLWRSRSWVSLPVAGLRLPSVHLQFWKQTNLTHSTDVQIHYRPHSSSRNAVSFWFPSCLCCATPTRYACVWSLALLSSTSSWLPTARPHEAESLRSTSRKGWWSQLSRLNRSWSTQ